MNRKNRYIKRGFDLILSIIGLMFFSWIIIIAIIIATFDTKQFGLFKQKRVGQNGKLFKLFKIRSMKDLKGVLTTVSTSKDPRITKIGSFWRRTKIDELPQLFNVLIGDMSFVGPRPDVPGFADRLKPKDQIILSIKPGITGPASIFFKNEQELLAQKKDPEKYNREVIWPKKIEINKLYIKEYSFFKDIMYIIRTILS